MTDKEGRGRRSGQGQASDRDAGVIFVKGKQEGRTG